MASDEATAVFAAMADWPECSACGERSERLFSGSAYWEQGRSHATHSGPICCSEACLRSLLWFMPYDALYHAEISDENGKVLFYIVSTPAPKLAPHHSHFPDRAASHNIAERMGSYTHGWRTK